MDKTHKWVITLFSIGVFMAALDNGIITSALTTIIHSFQVTTNWGAWSITIYTLGLAISVPIVGKLSDKYGRKRLFLIEITLFGLGSLLVALSPNFTWFLISRVIQSLGGGGIFIIASSYVLNVFPKEKQGRVLGMLGGMNGIASILGPNIGSFILDFTGNWHWLFFINLPIALFLFVFGLIYIVEGREENPHSLDWLGISFLTLAILSFMYGLTNLDGVNILDSISQPTFYAFVGAGLLLLVFLYFMEGSLARKGGDPIMPVELLKRPTYRWTLFIGFLSGAFLASVIFIPGYVEQYLGVEASKSGYWFTPLALASGIGAGGGGVLVDKRGPIGTLIIASIICFIGFILFPLWVDTTWQMVVASCLVGLGFGMMLGAPVNVLATEGTEHNKGVSLGTLSLVRQIGMTIFPTIYAGFIARSFSSMGEEMKTNFQNAGVNQGMIPPGEMEKFMEVKDFQSMMNLVEQIPVPLIRETLTTTIHEAVGRGFNQLFICSAILAIICLISVFILGAIRKQKNAKEIVVGESEVQSE